MQADGTTRIPSGNEVLLMGGGSGHVSNRLFMACVEAKNQLPAGAEQVNLPICLCGCQDACWRLGL